MEENIGKLVSLTFDEDPEVRKQAAKSLGTLDDPAAVFALVELSFDKDPSVRDVAQHYLDKRRYTEPELMSFAKIFSSGAKKEELQAPGLQPMDARAKLLLPITQIFEKRLGKEKAEAVKSKMMPTIEKIYLKTVQHHGSKKKTEEHGREAMQEFLTSYLEVMSDIDQIGNETPVAEIEHVSPSLPPEIAPPAETELEEVGNQTKVDGISSQIADLEMQEATELKEEEEIEKLPDTFFKKAYQTMMLSGGDEGVMRREMNKMVDEAKREIVLAFKLAKKRFKETKITNITKIKDGMRNINTEVLSIASAENITYKKTKKQTATLTRVVVNDEAGNEGVVYLFDDRGIVLKSLMRIKIVHGMAKSFDFSGETALVLGKKGNVYIVL